MELDDLKQAWQALDRRLERQDALQLHLLRTTHLGRAYARLRPLALAAHLQIIAGAALTVLFLNLALTRPDSPAALVCSLLLALYAIVLLLSGVRERVLIAGIEYDAPVVEIQRRLAALRAWRIRSTLWLGLPWWLLWIAAQILAFSLVGLDLVAHAPLAVVAEVAVCLAGFALSLWLYRWAHRSGRTRLAHALERGLAGRSVERAASELAEILRFARD
jgi:hypothetical protein